MTSLTSRFELLVIVVLCSLLHFMILLVFLFLVIKQGYRSGHHLLDSTMKQVLTHEVSDAICISFSCSLDYM